MNPTDSWGITKNDRQTVHSFRNGRRRCPLKNHTHGWLFLPLQDWNPENERTCPICRDILRLERVEELAKENREYS
jgi:hypothetical protein